MGFSLKLIFPFISVWVNSLNGYMGSCVWWEVEYSENQAYRNIYKSVAWIGVVPPKDEQTTMHSSWERRTQSSD